MARTRRFLPIAAVIATVVAGCGGDAPVLTHAQLVAKADPICASASRRRSQATALLGGRASSLSSITLAGFETTAPGVAAYESEAVSKLRQLRAPAFLARDWQSMLAGLQRLANDTALLGKYAKKKNVAAVQRVLAGSRSTRTQLLAIANRDGFVNCGRHD
jgi:hypothetical protein